MQFVRQGPDVPERLVQAHEEGRVVFFCGAGISYPAGLPSFSGLVDKLYGDLAVTPNPVQQTAIETGHFDTAIGLLESSIVGGREKVRLALARILTPDLTAPAAMKNHQALLALATARNGPVRLVTTNFDRLFEETIAAGSSTDVSRFRAPHLPVPKNRWNGVVYLHGLLDKEPKPRDLDQLVLSSGDFGLAYLTERWAARFVSELFRNYTVCFVGYSISDPVLRYMMDALAADRVMGEAPPEMFAFGSYSRGKEEARSNEWRAKNVTPILYQEHRRHLHLRRTLEAWADTYRDGVRGKERIVVESAIARPMASTKQDDFVGRLLWAISDPSGRPAKRFAEMDPTPVIDWLEPLAEQRYRQSDLVRFGVAPRAEFDSKLTFSTISRPTPYHLAPLMALVDSQSGWGRWDEVMSQLARWLVRHLDDPALVLWIAKRGGRLNPIFARIADSRIDTLTRLQRDGDVTTLERIRASAPNGVPRPLMLVLWRLLLTGRVKTWGHDPVLYEWLKLFHQDGLTATLRLALREALLPRVSLRDPIRWSATPKPPDEPERMTDLVNWEISLPAGDIRNIVDGLSGNRLWATALPDLLEDFCILLRDVMDLMRELGGADDRSDLSFMHRPSIADHPQNAAFTEWTVLVDLARDAWLATASERPNLARLVSESWSQAPYPIFRRLAFFAAAQGDLIPPSAGLAWLLVDRAWWLWSLETEREALRLVAALAPRLDGPNSVRLEQAILAGPPQDMFRPDMHAAERDRLVDRDIWLRLAKFRNAGGKLRALGRSRLTELSAAYPDWQLAEDEHDEFPVWSDGVDWSGLTAPLPVSRRELVEWLKRPVDPGTSRDDDWPQRCRDDLPTAVTALCALARERYWPAERWQAALSAWSEEKLLRRSSRYLWPVLVAVPDDALRTFANAASRWLGAIAGIGYYDDAGLLALARRILEFETGQDTAFDDPLTVAINHQVGMVTEALVKIWFKRAPEDGQGLPDDIRPLFSALCDVRTARFRHGRVILASHVIALFRVDREWVAEHLIPLFDWRRNVADARAAWAGFLWSPRLYRPLFELLKPAFLDTARHYRELGERATSYASLLTFAALDRGDIFSVREMAEATSALPQDGLRASAHALAQALEAAGEQRGAYWENRMKPYLRAVWPKTKDKRTEDIANNLSLLCIAAKETFPAAFAELRDWILPAVHPDYLVRRLHQEGICGLFPDQSLDFLDLIVPVHPGWQLLDLGACLQAIRQAAPALSADQRFRRLELLAG